MSAPQKGYLLLKYAFSAALEANDDLCSLVGRPTNIFAIFDTLGFVTDFDGMTPDALRKVREVPRSHKQNDFAQGA